VRDPSLTTPVGADDLEILAITAIRHERNETPIRRNGRPGSMQLHLLSSQRCPDEQKTKDDRIHRNHFHPGKRGAVGRQRTKKKATENTEKGARLT